MSKEFTYTTPDPLTIELSPPVETGGGVLDKITLREPTANEVLTAEQHLTAKNGTRANRMYQRSLVAKVSGLSESALDDVPVSSFTRAASYLQAFVEAGLADPNANDEIEPATSLTITLDESREIGGVSYSSITVTEPTLGIMAKADAALGDMSPYRVRMFQQSVVTLASGGKTGVLVGKLPISVLNRAATFVMGFSTAGRGTST